MDQQAVLSHDSLRVGLELIREVRDFYPISVAFWMNYRNDEQFFLCLGSEELTSDNFQDLNARVFKAAVSLGSFDLDPMTVRLVSSEEPVYQRAIELRDELGITRSSSNRVKYHGGSVESMYVYSARHLQQLIMH